MSFDTLIGIIDKETYEKMSECTSFKELAEVMNIQKHYCPDEEVLPSGYWLDSFAFKNVNGDAVDLDKNDGVDRSFFKNKEFNEYANEDEYIFRVYKEDLLSLIELYEQRTRDSYLEMTKKMIALKKEGKLEEAMRIGLSEIRLKMYEWDRGALEKDINEKRVCKSDNIEYAVFDLLNLYKSVDFENQILFINRR